MVLGYGLDSYMMGAYNPYMMGASAMINPGSFLNFKNENDMKSFYNSSIDDSQAALYASGQGRISRDTYSIAGKLRTALKEKDSSAAGSILNEIRGDKYMLAGVEQAYDNMSGSRAALRQDVRRGMEGSRFFDHFGMGAVNDIMFGAKKAVLNAFGLEPMTENEAIDILNDGTEVSTTVAANALYDATKGPADDRTINRVLEASSGRMGEIDSSYRQMGDLTHDINRSHYFFYDGPAAAERLNTRVTGLMFNA